MTDDLTPHGPDAPPDREPPAQAAETARFEAAKARASAWLRGADGEYRGTTPAEHVLEEIYEPDADVVDVLAGLLASYETREVDEYVEAGILPADPDFPGQVGEVVRSALGLSDGEVMGSSHPRNPDPRCRECGALLGDADRAEVYLNPDALRRQAGGQHVLVDDIPEEAFGPFLVHADPCYLANTETYTLA